MTDEEYELVQDTRDKKHTARSAMKRRSHCGKRGRVRFPSDNLTKKELRAMSGECKSWRLNEPMKWNDFKYMPADLQKTYIRMLQEKYDAPIGAIAKMMGVDQSGLNKYLKSRGVDTGGARGKRKWQNDEFWAWVGGVQKPKEEIEEEQIPTMPEEGGEVDTEFVLEQTVNLTPEWDWEREYDKVCEINKLLTAENNSFRKENAFLVEQAEKAKKCAAAIRPADQTDWEAECHNCQAEMSGLEKAFERLCRDCEDLKKQNEGLKLLRDCTDREMEILRAKLSVVELIFGGRKCVAEV